MSRRIEIELTSARDDGTWTWRAAGAREPRGTVPASLVGDAAKVGDVLRVDADFFLDGIEITAVVRGRGPRQEAERLELLDTGRKDEPLVTTTLARGDRGDRRGGGDRRDRGDRGDRRDRGDGRDRPRSDRERGERKDAGDRPRRDDPRDRREPRRARPPRPEAPPIPVVERPKAKRLRPGRTHRTALLDSVPEEQRPIAEQVVLGGLPAVRQAIEKQNAERAAAGESAIAAGPLLELAEKLVPKVRAAEWRDRAEAAKRDLDVLDLRDLRSVVSAADSAARDEETRTLARELREGLAARVDAEHATWLEELTAVVEVGRIVRALRLSSRPPKAGAPLPPDLAAKLADGAGAALTADAAPERWVAVLDALAFSPVRDRVIPHSLPTSLHDDVKATLSRLATRLPKIAHIFEVEPDPSAPRPERRRPPKPKKPADKRAPAKGTRADGPNAGTPETGSPSAEEAASPAEEGPATPGPEPATPSEAAADHPQAEEAPAADTTAGGAPAEDGRVEKAVADAADAAPAPVPGGEEAAAPVGTGGADAGPAPEPGPAAGVPAPEPDRAPEPTPAPERDDAPVAGAEPPSPPTEAPQPGLEDAPPVAADDVIESTAPEGPEPG